MVRKDEIINSIVRTLEQSQRLSDDVNFLDHEPSIETESVKLPVIEVSPDGQERMDDENSDFVGFQKDDDGNRVGRIYETLYSLNVQIQVWTAQDSRYDVRGISDSVRDTLYEHDTKVEGRPLRDESGEPIDGIWQFRLEDGEHTDDLNTSPPLRRWQQNLRVSASEQYVVTPEEGPISGYTL